MPIDNDIEDIYYIYDDVVLLWASVEKRGDGLCSKNPRIPAQRHGWIGGVVEAG